MTSERFLITGAAQHERYRRSHLKRLQAEDRLEEVYSKAVMLEVDFAAKRIVRRLEVPREEIAFAVPGYSTNFTVPARVGDRLLAPSHGAIYEIALGDFGVEGVRSHRLYNDLHHVAVEGGRLHAVSTGLDRVVTLPLEERGEKATAEVRPVIGGLAPLDDAIDYRALNTKPHRSHPNFLFHVGGEAWATRAKQFDCATLDAPERAVALSDVMVHDGVAFEGSHYFTAVKGQVIRAELAGGDPASAVRERHDLIAGRWHLLTGWCRGLHVTDDYCYVGFSVFRRTKQIENLAWLKAKLTGANPPMPTRIEKIDRRTGALLDAMTFDPLDLNAIFWIGRV